MKDESKLDIKSIGYEYLGEGIIKGVRNYVFVGKEDNNRFYIIMDDERVRKFIDAPHSSIAPPCFTIDQIKDLPESGAYPGSDLVKLLISLGEKI